jgi:N-acetylglucosamine-6-phosphate deacetylase
LGFHLEGPFLSFTGALPPEAIGKADKKRVLDLIEAAKPYPAIFSISPDFKDIETIIPLMKANGPAVFMTHTAANVEQTLRAIELGACHATHFYDVFYAPKESDPGVRPCGAVEAILADRQVSVDFILDGEHVDPVAVKMAIACKGSEKVCLISDASPGGGAKPGVYDFVGTKVKISYPGGPARMVSGNSLAGSGLTMDIAVKNAIKLLGLDIAAAVKMASTNPAKVLKIENQKGQIMKGCDADLVLLDKDMNVQKTWVNGICEYEKPQLSSQA